MQTPWRVATQQRAAFTFPRPGELVSPDGIFAARKKTLRGETAPLPVYLAGSKVLLVQLVAIYRSGVPR